METTTTIPVRSFHTDCFGHVYHGRYVELLEEGRWAYMENNPAIAAALHKEGIGHAVVHLSIRYHSEARLGDRLDITTRVQAAGRHGVTMAQTIANRRTGRQVVSAEVTNLYYRGNLQSKVPVNDPVFDKWDDLQAVSGGYGPQGGPLSGPP